MVDLLECTMMVLGHNIVNQCNNTALSSLLDLMPLCSSITASQLEAGRISVPENGTG